MQVTQDIRQPLRQGRKMNRRLTIEFSSRQSDLLAVDGFEQGNRRRVIGTLVRQTWIEAFDLFALALQSPCDLYLDQALYPDCQCQQISHSDDLVIVAHEERVNPDRLILEPVVVALSAPVSAIVSDTNLERNCRRRIAELHAPAQSPPSLGNCLAIALDAFHLAAALDDFTFRSVSPGASASDQADLFLFFNLPSHLEQPADLVLFQHGRECGFKALFVTILMTTLSRFGRQRFDFHRGLRQPILQRLRLCCPQILGTKYLDTLTEAEVLERPIRTGRNLRRTLTRELVTVPNQFAILFAQRRQRVRAAQGLINPSRQRLRGLTDHRRNGQIVIARKGNLRAGLKRSHLRVAHIEHTHKPQHLPCPRNQRQIEPFIGGLAVDHLRGTQISVWVHGHAHQFQLRQIGATIFAITALHHPALVHLMVATCRRRIAMCAVEIADARLQNLINGNALLPDHRFKPLPAIFLREPREQTAEPVVIEIPGANLLQRQRRQEPSVAVGPFLDLVLGMVTLGQDKCYPDRDNPPSAQARVRSVISDLTVVDIGNAQLDYQAKQQRNITDSDMGKLECLTHSLQRYPDYFKNAWFRFQEMAAIASMLWFQQALCL